MINEEKLKRFYPNCDITKSCEDRNYSSYIVSSKGFVVIALVSKTNSTQCYVHNYNGKLLKEITL